METGEKMRENRRRFLQGVCSVCVFVYLGAVLGRSIRVSAASAEPQPETWHERSPKSVDLDYVADYGEDLGDGVPGTPTPAAELQWTANPRFAYLLEREVSHSSTPKAAATEAPPSSTPNLQKTEAEEDENQKHNMENVFISVKTSGQFHKTRLKPILDTWFPAVKEQTWFFTDVDDEDLLAKTDGHVINTNCSSSHRRDALCCKMAVEYDTFLDSDKQWFCHFDDDNYVNTERLAELLAGYSSKQDWYLGKNSIRTPLQIMDRAHNGDRISFWFGTGGAGFCLSRALALKMSPFASGGRFMRVGDKIRLPDDVTMGYIIEHLLKTRLTVVDEFHSHLEQMKFIRPDVLDQQISFSYSKYADEMNVVDLDLISGRDDPTRFYSLHCLLHPDAKFCPR